MTTIINASTSSGLVFQADQSGVLQFQNNGVNLPMPGVAPAFYVYCSAGQTISTATWTKLNFNTKIFDTNNNFDTTTNYRFTPTVAGYYQFNASFFVGTNTSTRPIISIYKNGTSVVQALNAGSSLVGGISYGISYMANANGSTDYFEVYVYQDSGSNATMNQDQKVTYFQGFLARGA